MSRGRVKKILTQKHKRRHKGTKKIKKKKEEVYPLISPITRRRKRLLHELTRIKNKKRPLTQS